MSLALDIPDVTVKAGRMAGAIGRPRLSGLTGLALCLTLWTGSMLLFKALYIQEVRIPQLVMVAEDIGNLITRLQGLDQRLVEELDLIDIMYPPPPPTYADV